MIARALAISKLAIRSRKTGTALGKVFVHVFLVASGLGFALPLFWLISSSLKADKQLLAFPPIWIPHPVD